MIDRLPIWITVDGTEPSSKLAAFLQETTPFGVILFARHLLTSGQVRDLNAAIRETLPGVRIALDQEGGRVSRLKAIGFDFPGAEAAHGNPEVAEEVAREMGEALLDLGFDVDFAPVSDLGPAAVGTGLETRCYGDDSETVISCCRAALRGLSFSGVEGCLKHFPGLGGSVVDSHKDLPHIAGDRAAREAHLAPYAALGAEAPFVMTAHGRYDFLGGETASSLLPGTYDLLRELGFTGLSVSDDLNMGAVKGEGPLWVRALRALGAGADIALWVGAEAESREACARLRVAREKLSPEGTCPKMVAEEAP